MRGVDLMTEPSSKNLEWRIVQAYVSLIVAGTFVDGERIAPFARHGAYEVRLVEPTSNPRSDATPFWVELFNHRSKTTLDSFGSYRLEEVAAAADALISTAKLLHQEASRP